MWIVLIIGIIIFIISLIAYVNKHDWTAYAFGAVGAYIISGAIIFLHQDKRPSALDVYQGKTTLEVTYKNDVPMDTVVVFK